MESHDTLQTMLTVGKKYSIDVSDLKSLPLKIIVLSVKFVSREALWKMRFGEEHYVHWELVNMLNNKNVLGGSAEWLGMLEFCKWEELSKVESEIAHVYHPLHILRRNMRECNLDTGGTDAWTLACKVFLLMLVQGIPSLLHVLEVLTCSQFKKNTHSGCIQLLAKQVSNPTSLIGLMTREQCTDLLVTGRAPVHTRRVRVDHQLRTGQV